MKELQSFMPQSMIYLYLESSYNHTELSCSHLLPLPKLLQPTIYFYHFFILVVPRYSNKLSTEGGLHKIEMLLQKQKRLDVPSLSKLP
jgi:hypothetical protein